MEYVFSRYRRLMNPEEQEEYRRLMLQRKGFSRPSSVMEGGTDPAPRTTPGFRTEAFRRKVARRLLREHAKEIRINHCPRCRALVWDSKLRQCIECGHVWKNTALRRP